MIVRSDPAKKGKRAQHREHIFWEKLPQSNSEQDQPEHFRLLPGLRSGVLSLLFLGLKEGCLTQAVPKRYVSAIESHVYPRLNLRCEPGKLGIIDQELPGDCRKSVPSPHDALRRSRLAMHVKMTRMALARTHMKNIATSGCTFVSKYSSAMEIGV